MINKPELFLTHNAESDLKASLTLYQQDLTPERFAATVMGCLKETRPTACSMHSFKSGSFGMIFKILVQYGNTQKTYFLKFYRNRTPMAEYTPERMKVLCQREYMILKTVHQKLSGGENGIGVITPIDIITDMACFITASCDGENLQEHLCSKTREYFLNPFNRLNKRPIMSFLYWHVERVAKLLATVHELDLDYKLFNEQEPFHVLDFEYKKEKFLNTVKKFDASLHQKALYWVDILNKKTDKIFPSLQSTGLATPDTNLTNFIFNANKIYMMDFFLIQYGPCYQPIAKFIACLELVMYGLIPREIIAELRKKFIETYKAHARRHIPDPDTLELFINWNYMTFVPRYGAPWKRFYQKRIFQKKLKLILENWQNSIKQSG